MTAEQIKYTQPELFHMIAQKHALKLEIAGLKHSRGSVYAHIKRTYGFKGNKQSVLDQFTAFIEEAMQCHESQQ